MKVYALATLRGKDNSIIGARLIDLDDNNKIMDVDIRDIYNAMLDNRIDIINLKLDKYSKESHSIDIKRASLEQEHNNNTYLCGRYCLLDEFPSLGPAELKYEKKYWDALDNYTTQLSEYVETNKEINIKVEDNYMNQLDKLIPLFIERETSKVLISDLRGRQKQAKNIYVLDSRAITLKCSYKEIDGTISYGGITNGAHMDTILSGLDAQVGDPSVLWTINDFEKYMTAHNYRYKLNNVGKLKLFTFTNRSNDDDAYELGNISPDCKIIHIPNGVVRTKNLYASAVTEIDTIIFPPTINQVSYGIFTDRNEDSPRVSIKNIYFQDGNYTNVSFQLSMFKNLHITGDIVLPKDFYSMENMFRNCTIDKPQNLVIDGKNLITCFNDCEFSAVNSDEVTIENVLSISECFNSCLNLKRLTTKFTRRDTFSEILKISYSFRECSLEEIHFIDENRLQLNEAFNNAKNLVSIKAEKAPYISCRNSFNKCSSLKKIETDSEYNFSTLVSSLNECGSLTKVDLSGCTELRSIREDILRDCENLAELILPNAIISIYCDLTKSKITYIHVPSEVITIKYENLPKDITLDFSNNNGKLSGRAVIFDYPGVKLNIINGFSKLHAMTKDLFEKFDKILEQNKITSVSESFLYYDNIGLKGKVFDTQEYIPDVKKLSSGAFYYTDCSTIIINDNITELGYNLFQGCEAVRICISDKVVDIPEEAFDGHNSSTTYYVIKGSEAYRVLRKKRARIQIIESIQDFIEMFGDMTPDKIQNKYKMLLSGSKFEVLLDDAYIGNIEQLYKMYYMLDANEEDTSGHVLDTSKFRSLELHKIAELNKIVNTLLTNSETVLPASRQNRDSFSNEFISLCNLYTKVCGEYDEAYSDQFITEANNSQIDSIFIYADNLSQIIKYSFTAVENIRLHMLAIIINNKIVFNTPVSKMTNKVEGYGIVNVLSPRYNFNSSETCNVQEYFSSIYKYTQEGDSLPQNSLNLRPIPPELKNIIIPRFARTSRLIGSTNALNKMIESNTLSSGKDKKLPLLLYDVEIQKFIQVECLISGNVTHKNVNISRLESMDIIKIFEFDQFDTISKTYLQDLYSSINDVKNINTLKLCCRDKNIMKELKNEPDAYNIKDEFMLSVCDAVYEHDIKFANQLNQKMFEAIAKTGLMRSVSMSVNDLRNNPQMKQNFYETATPDELIIVYCKENPVDNSILGKQYYIAYLTGTTSLKSKKGIVFESEMTLGSILKCLKSIGGMRKTSRCNGTETNAEDVRLTDNDIDLTKYYFTATQSLGLARNYDGFKIDLAIHTDTGFTSLIVEKWDMDFRELFRFKTYGDAMELFKKIVKACVNENEFGVDNELTWITELYLEIVSDSYSSYKLETKKWRELRNVVIKGAPNGFPIIAEKDKIELFNKLVKQPLLSKTV